MKNTAQIPVRIPWTPDAWKTMVVADIAGNDLFVNFWADWELTLCRSPRWHEYFEDVLVSMLLPGTPLDRCRRHPHYPQALSCVMSRPMTAELVGAMLSHLCECNCDESGYFTSPLQWFETLTVVCGFSEWAIKKFSANEQKELGDLIQVLRCTSLGALILALNAHFGVTTSQRQ